MSVLTDRITRTRPTLPTLGAAGSSYVDAVFGSTVTRITDATTPAGDTDDTGRSFRTPASTETRGWSCDGASFFLMSTFGTAEAFNASTRARIDTLAFQNEPTFSSATPGLLWGPDTTEHPQICSITTAGTKTVGLDLTDLVPSLLSGPRTYLGQLLTAGNPERLAVNFGGTSQDLHYLCLVADVSDLAGGRILDTQASTIDGVAIGTTLGFYLHSIGLDQTGRYVLLYPVAQVPPIVVWDTQTDTFTTLTFADDAPGGHGALGYGVYANQDATGTYDGLQYQLRSLATPHVSADLQVPLLSPVEIYLGTHPNWNNAKADSAEPIIVGTYREAAGLDEETYPWRAWDDEIISVATDGSFVISRYCHHRSDLSITSDDWGVFWYTPRPQVSPDGTKILYTSNFNGTLGDDATETGTPRQDVFMVQAEGSGGGTGGGSGGGDTGNLQTATGVFTQVAGTGTQTITGCGFTPKAVLFYRTQFTLFAGPCSYSLGFDDGTTHLGKAINSGDFLGSYDESESAASDAYSLVTTRNSAFNNINALGYVQSFTADGFVVKWDQDSNNWSAGIIWCYLAIGGSGVSAAVRALPMRTSPGVSAITGLAFEPTVVFTSYHNNVGGTLTGSGAAGAIGIGVAAACNLSQWGVSANIDAVANPSNTSTYQQQGSAFSAASASTVIIDAGVTAFTSDGLTVSWATVPGSAYYFACLLLGGVAANVGSFTQPTSTGTQTVSVTAASPKAILIVSANKAASASIQPNALISIGTATSPNAQFRVWTGDLDNHTPPTYAAYGGPEAALAWSRVPTGNGPSSLTSEASLTTLAAGTFALDWTTVDATAREWLYCVLGTDFGTGPCGESGPIVTTARTIRRLRRFPLYYADNFWISCSRFELILQQGIGLSSGQGVAPIVMFRYSTDGGFTWGNEIQMTAGPIGAYRWRTYVNRLPRARQPVVEITTTDPVFWAIVGASADVTVGTS